jgi:predicted nucleic acid-binding protein
MYLIDTDVVASYLVASYLNGRPDAVVLLRSLLPGGIAISVITFGEVFEGIYYGRNPAQFAAVFRRFLHGASVLEVDRMVARRFARLRGDLRRGGQLIGDADFLIAATALCYGLTLVTRNTRHVSRIPSLALHPLSP